MHSLRQDTIPYLEQLKAIFSESLDCLLVINDASIIVMVNKAAEHFFNSLEETMCGQPIQRFIYDYQNEFTSGSRKIISKGNINGGLGSFQLVINPLCIEGEKYNVLSIKPSNNSENQIIQLLSLNKEFTEFKWALDEASIIAITDNKGIIQVVNKKFCELSKYSREELLGMDHRILNSGFHPKEFFRDMWKTIGLGKIWRGEIQNKAKDGSLYWVHTTIVPMLNEKGKPYRYISIRIDITEQKQIESALKQAMKEDFNQAVRQLQENQWLYQSLFMHSQDAVFTFDTKRNIINMNPATEKILGYSFEDIQKTKLSTLIAAAKTEELHFRHFKKALQGEPQNFDTAVYHKNGKMVYLNVTFLPIILEHQINGVYAIGKDITEEKKVQELNAYLARHDELTKLLNRRGFEEKLDEAISGANINRQKLAVMYIDLDRFKNINDTLGHLIGDRVLEKISQRLQSQIGKGNFIARMGGDEFMVLYPVIENDEDSHVYANLLLNSLKEPVFVDDYELYVTASIGISIFPENGDNVVDLMKHADVALYKAKDQGRNTFQLYSELMDPMSYQSFFMERDLRKALIHNEFIVHLQPRVNVTTGKIIGAEALIRWNHPVYGLIQPSEFIPLAEETGLIIPMGKWMKQKVCEQLVKWKQEQRPMVPISINISPQRFLGKDFAKSVSQLLESYGLEGHFIEFEITENSLMKNETEVTQTINELKKLGIKIYIDDFGTGYSSFSYLKSFKLDGIKIDRYFIQNISSASENASITSAMIQLAQILGMEVVAEGVETEEELLYLQEQQCNQVQGFLFGKPSPIEQFGDLLVKEHAE